MSRGVLPIYSEALLVSHETVYAVLGPGLHPSLNSQSFPNQVIFSALDDCQCLATTKELICIYLADPLFGRWDSYFRL